MAGSPDTDMVYGDDFNESPASGSNSGNAEAGTTGAPSQQQTKRTRVLLSCAPCRISKLKCDREVPCGNCLKKDRIDLCEYAPRPKKPAKPAKGMAARLRRLEGMLRDMMDDDSALAAMSKFGVSSAELMNEEDGNGGGHSGAIDAPSLMATLTDAEAEGYDGTGRPIPTTATTAPSLSAAAAADQLSAQHQGQQQIRGKGRVIRGQRATTYVGATHFMAMLDDIEDLKAYFDDPQVVQDDDRQEGSPEYDPPELLVVGAGIGRPRNKMDLLALMPPRNVVDRLIMRYFGSNTPSQHTLHRPSFSRKYKQFWQDPASAENDYVAVLFIIIALGVHFSSFSAPQELELDGTAMTPAERYKLYRSAASSALALNRFSNPSLRTLQAMIMIIESEFVVNRASQTNCFLLLAVCIRLMLKMGLHRDPSRLPTLSAFEGEIRRRLWNLAIQLDLIVSFYLGLPSMIHGIPSDTSLAHNLLDEDFDEDSPVLPTPRPETEYTVMSYPIFKSMVCRIFGQVARLAHTLTPPKYVEVMRTDRLLEDKWRQIPKFMKVRPLGDCVADSPMQVIQRFGLASLYQKSRCVLHRPYLVEAVPLPEHSYSRRTCLQSALTLLEYHEAINEAIQPGGLLYQIGWFITGLGMHDFLLAAMIVYLVVQNDNLFESDLLTSRHKSTEASQGRQSDYNMEQDTPSTHTTSGGAPTVSSTTTTSTSSSGAFSGAASSSTGASTSASASATTDQGETTDALLSEFGNRVALPVDRNVLIELLRRSYRIWADLSEKNTDVSKAADLLAMMLRKIYARELRENGGPPDWSPPSPRHHDTAQQQQQKNPPETLLQPSHERALRENSGNGNGTYADVNYTGSVPPLSEATLRSLGIQESPVPLDLMGAQSNAVSGAQMGFLRRDLVPPAQLPAGAINSTAGAPTRYDSWIPLSLDALDWGTVDTGIRASSSQETEWTTENSVLNDINYAETGLWE